MPVDVDADAVGQFVALRLGRGPVDLGESAAPDRYGFVAEDQVFQKAQVRCEHEFLMHHADPLRQRFGRTGEGHGHIHHCDLPTVGPFDALQHAHECRFPGSVFPHDGVDFAGGDGKRDAAVGLNRTVAFPDVGGAECDGGHSRLTA